eukprot:153320-Rhodomonas_salina.1
MLLRRDGSAARAPAGVRRKSRARFDHWPRRLRLVHVPPPGFDPGPRERLTLSHVTLAFDPSQRCSLTFPLVHTLQGLSVRVFGLVQLVLLAGTNPPARLYQGLEPVRAAGDRVGAEELHHPFAAPRHERPRHQAARR